MAASALGVALAVALITDGFRRPGPSLLFGGAVGITLLIRFLTGSYLALIFAALLGWILAGAERRRRVGHLLSLTHGGRTMAEYSEVFVAFDVAKRKHAVAIAESGRTGEVRFLGELENRRDDD